MSGWKENYNKHFHNITACKVISNLTYAWTTSKNSGVVTPDLLNYSLTSVLSAYNCITTTFITITLF